VLRIPWGATALLLDRQFGLLLFSPVLLLGIAGAARVWARDRLLGATLIMAALFFAGVGGSFSMWWGGASAPARFLIGAAPALLFFCGALWNNPPRSHTRAILAAAGGFGAGLVLLACMAPRALHNRADGESGLLRLLSPVTGVDRFFPGFVDEGTSLLPAVLWGATLIAAVIRPIVALIPVTALVALTSYGSNLPFLDPFKASLRTLEAWDDHRRSFGGSDRADAFLLDIPLGESAWDLTPGERLYSPRFSLPPGEWTLHVAFRATPTPDAHNVGRLSIIGDDEGITPFASTILTVDVNAATERLALDTHQRRLRVRADGLQSRVRILSVTLRPTGR
jgi:hypothetical protein